MSPRASIMLAALAGLLAGALTTVSIQAPAKEPEATSTSVSDASPTPIRPAPVARPDEEVLLVWTASGLPRGFADAVAALPQIEDVTSVAGGRVDLIGSHDPAGEPVDHIPPGWAVPLDSLAIEPSSYQAFVPAADRSTVTNFERGTALLGETSARLRRLDTGDTVTLTGGRTLTVAAVVDDALVGAAELVVPRTEAARLGIDTERFLLVAHDGDRAQIESAIRRLVDVEVRVRGPGETPWRRHGDAVLPQAIIKDRFGEFLYRSGPGREFVQDPEWVANHIVAVEVPVLGRVRCHRGVIRQLRGALEELDDRGLGHLVDPETFAGCHHPRLIAAEGMPSRHAWGIALDLNAAANPTGLVSSQDPRLVETLVRWGLTWGGFWLVPDAMHVEYVGPPTPEPGKVVLGQ